MNDTSNQKTPNGLAIKLKLSAKDEHLANIRERQRRQRKEELYSYPTKNRKSNS